MITNATLGDCVKLGERISAYCNSCRHRADLNVEALADKLGPEHGAMFKDLAPLLKCSACGVKNVHLTYSPKCNESVGMSRNNWGGT